MSTALIIPRLLRSGRRGRSLSGFEAELARFGLGASC
jgi:hypothetical protein